LLLCLSIPPSSALVMFAKNTHAIVDKNRPYHPAFHAK
jgi:hypothetical protein